MRSPPPARASASPTTGRRAPLGAWPPPPPGRSPTPPRGVPQGGPHDGRLLDHGQPWGELHPAHGCRRPPPSPDRQDAQVLFEVRVREHLHDDRGPAATGVAGGTVQVARRGVVQDVAGARAAEVHLGPLQDPTVQSCGAGVAGQLGRGDPDAAAGAVDEHGLRPYGPAFWNSARQAVTQGTPTAAPCPYDSEDGSRMDPAASTTARLRVRARKPGVPSAPTNTRSPGAGSASTPSPAASTTPAPSDSVYGRLGVKNAYVPVRM